MEIHVSPCHTYFLRLLMSILWMPGLLGYCQQLLETRKRIFGHIFYSVEKLEE